jgi:hypothetical protein
VGRPTPSIDRFQNGQRRRRSLPHGGSRGSGRSGGGGGEAGLYKLNPVYP